MQEFPEPQIEVIKLEGGFHIGIDNSGSNDEGLE